jgi:hypothetical protein
MTTKITSKMAARSAWPPIASEADGRGASPRPQEGLGPMKQGRLVDQLEADVRAHAQHVAELDVLEAERLQHARIPERTRVDRVEAN